MQKTVGSYRIIHEISSGGMGKVYKALHTSLERTVAIKMIHPELLTNSRILDNFYNEAKIQAKLNHPNIATVYDFFEYENKHYVVMEYVEGESISKIIKHIGPFDIDIAISILKQILNGLTYAHSKNVIHKDIKSSNFLLTPNTVKIIDFGIAQMLDESAKDKKNDLLLGTPNYMSPEQIRGDIVDKRTDIYSLGIVLYEFLTGNVPLDLKEKNNPEETTTGHEPVTDFNPDIPDRLVDIINKATDPDPGRRFQTTEEFLHAVHKISVNNEHYVKESKKAASDESGSLSQKTVAELFCSHYYKKSTGILSVDSEDSVNIHFYNGYINFVEHRDPSLMLGEMLVKNEKITDKERNKALDFLHETGKKIGECLIDLGKITPHELNEILQNQIMQKIQIALECKEGTYDFKYLAEPRTEIIYSVYPIQAVYGLVPRGLLQTKKVEEFNPRENYFIKPTRHYLNEIDQIKFSSLKEIKLCNILKEEISLKDILESSPLKTKHSVRFLNFLYTCNLIKIEQKKQTGKHDKGLSYYQSLQEDKTVAMSEEEIKELMKK